MTEDPRNAARQSHTGQRLTEAEFKDAYAIVGVIDRDIRKTGSFYETRENYAFAYSKGKKISPDQAQGILNDIYKARFGQSMNQTREALNSQATKVTAEDAAPYAQKVGQLIQEGETMPFYKALDQAAGEMSQTLSITEKHAKALMKEAHAAQTDKPLYDVGKELEAAYHVPAMAKKQAQKPESQARLKTQKQKLKQR